jgi:hypothetical protein
MKRKNCLSFLLLTMVLGSIIGCNGKSGTGKETDATNKCPTLPTLAELAAAAGTANAFIDESEAVKERHNFDRYFRNPSRYDASGNIIDPTARGAVPPGDDYPISNQGTKFPQGNDSFTRGVWIDKKVIAYLSALLQDSSCDGVRIYMSAYDTMQTGCGQGYIPQSTIYMVPTKALDSTNPSLHTDDYNVVQEINNNLKKYYLLHLAKMQAQQKDSITSGEALNHGELCPTDCSSNDTTGNSVSIASKKAIKPTKH